MQPGHEHELPHVAQVPPVGRPLQLPGGKHPAHESQLGHDAHELYCGVPEQPGPAGVPLPVLLEQAAAYTKAPIARTAHNRLRPAIVMTAGIFGHRRDADKGPAVATSLRAPGGEAVRRDQQGMILPSCMAQPGTRIVQ